MSELNLQNVIFDLTQHAVPSGSESVLTPTLQGYIQAIADELFVDRLGTLIARKHGSGREVLLAAHVDEPGVMVVDIVDHGFLRLVSIGPVDAAWFVNRRVRFTNGVTGLVGVESDVDIAEMTFDHLYVDIGSNSKEAAAARVRVGLGGVVDEDAVVLDGSRLAGRALDNRVGCAIAIAAFTDAAAAGHAVAMALTAQHVVGARGAKTAAFQLQPSLAFVVGAARAGDTPSPPRSAVELGKGPAIKLLDRSVIVPTFVKEQLQTAARQVQLDVQYDIWAESRSDAGVMEATAGGIAVGGVSYPARGAGQLNTVIDVNDAKAAVQLLCTAISNETIANT